MLYFTCARRRGYAILSYSIYLSHCVITICVYLLLQVLVWWWVWFCTSPVLTMRWWTDLESLSSSSTTTTAGPLPLPPPPSSSKRWLKHANMHRHTHSQTVNQARTRTVAAQTNTWAIACWRESSRCRCARAQREVPSDTNMCCCSTFISLNVHAEIVWNLLGCRPRCLTCAHTHSCTLAENADLFS